MELTLNEPEADALAAIEALAAAADDLGALVGAGTVLSISAAKRAVDAGARFIVSPHTDAELIAWCALSGVPCFPGALSPTEILTAWNTGASAVKLFPAAAVGPGYLKQLSGPFPGIEITGPRSFSVTRIQTSILSGNSPPSSLMRIRLDAPTRWMKNRWCRWRGRCQSLVCRSSRVQ